MIPSESAARTLECLWQCLREIADNGNELIVTHQTSPGPRVASDIAHHAEAIAEIARTAQILVHYAGGYDEP
ncbi:MAG: hypothetical protein ABW199_09875 [Caulobacterales bacterium]